MPSLDVKVMLSLERGLLHYRYGYKSCQQKLQTTVNNDGEIVLTDKFFRLSELRKLRWDLRVQAGASQYLVYKDPTLYIAMVHSEISQSYLCGVKHHPFFVPTSVNIEESEICECCPPPKELKTINMSRLQAHWRTRKHVCTKWQITVNELKDGIQMLKMKLRLMGVNVQN